MHLEVARNIGLIVQRLKGGDYHLSGEFTGPTSSSSLFGVDFDYKSAKLGGFSDYRGKEKFWGMPLKS